MKGKNKMLSLIPAAISLLLMIGVMTVFNACGPKDDGTFMHCHDAQKAAASCGAVTTVLLTVSAFIRNKAVRIVLDSVVLILSGVTFFIPGTIMPMCMMNTMRCYSVMQPFVRIMTVILAITVICEIISTVRSRRTPDGKVYEDDR